MFDFLLPVLLLWARRCSALPKMSLLLWQQLQLVVLSLLLLVLELEKMWAVHDWYVLLLWMALACLLALPTHLLLQACLLSLLQLRVPQAVQVRCPPLLLPLLLPHFQQEVAAI